MNLATGPDWMLKYLQLCPFESKMYIFYAIVVFAFT